MWIVSRRYLSFRCHVLFNHAPTVRARDHRAGGREVLRENRPARGAHVIESVEGDS
jgi:hypothetical protein